MLNSVRDFQENDGLLWLLGVRGGALRDKPKGRRFDFRYLLT